MIASSEPSLEPLRPWSVARAAQALDLHPFEVIRILATDGTLPGDLRLHPADVARVVEVGGLESWWTAERGRDASLARMLAEELLSRRIIDPTWTRADNLFRGLPPAEQAVVRQAVNGWIRLGALGTRMSARGLELTVRPSAVDQLVVLASQGAGSYGGVLEGE